MTTDTQQPQTGGHASGYQRLEPFTKHGSIVAWLVWAPVGDECEYYVFTERIDAYDKQADFDEQDPDHEHAIEALVCHPTFDYRTFG